MVFHKHRLGKIIRSSLMASGFLALGFALGNSASPIAIKPVPLHEFKIEREAYHLAYDGQHKQAKWVYEHLTSDRINGEVDRNNFDFQVDPLIPPILRSTKGDYAKSGYDRGHLCPVADACFGDKALKETFYLSNISPQHPHFNRGYWLKLEKYVRDLTNSNRSIHVFTGGLYLPQQERDGKRYIRYQVIGKNDVAVPTHFFKVILDARGKLIESFILPNGAIASDTPLQQFSVALEQIEKAAGMVFDRNK